MIRLDRIGLVASSELAAANAEMFEADDHLGPVLAGAASSHAAWKSVREDMVAAQHWKCGWCESLLDERSIEMDHIRPKGKERYWWLAFELNNLLAACRSCNNAKRSDWPLGSGSARLPPRELPWVVSEVDAPVDPTVEDPTPHFEFVDLGGRWKLAGLSDRGMRTLAMLELDRDTLSGKMTHHVKRVVEPAIGRARMAMNADDEDAWNEAAVAVAEICASTEPYSALTSFLVRRAFGPS